MLEFITVVGSKVHKKTGILFDSCTCDLLDIIGPYERRVQ